MGVKHMFSEITRVPTSKPVAKGRKWCGGREQWWKLEMWLNGVKIWDCQHTLWKKCGMAVTNFGTRKLKGFFTFQPGVFMPWWPNKASI